MVGILPSDKLASLDARALIHKAGCGFDRPCRSRYVPVMPPTGPHRLDRSWRKSRIAARILLRESAGRLTARDRRLAPLLAADKGVTSRLIDQAIHGIRGRTYQLELSRRAAA